MSQPPDDLCSREGGVRVHEYPIPDGLAVNGPAEAVFAAHTSVGWDDWVPEFVSERIRAPTGIVVSAWDGRTTDARLSADSWLVGLHSLRCTGLYRWTFVMTPREHGLRTFDAPRRPVIDGRRWVLSERLNAFGHDVVYAHLEAEERLVSEPRAVVAPPRVPVTLRAETGAAPAPPQRPPLPPDGTSLWVLAFTVLVGVLLGAVITMRGRSYRRMLRGWKRVAPAMAGFGAFLLFCAMLSSAHAGMYAILLGIVLLPLGLAFRRSEAAPPPQVAETPGRFEYVRIVGRGATSEVWEARDLELGNRRVAIKRRPFLTTAMGLRERAFYVNEAKSVAKLDHPNIVRILGILEEEREVLLVFEFIEGRTLAQAVVEKGPMTWGEVVRIIGPVCRAVDYAHQNGMVHRDIKPSNIMLASSGDIKLADFGIARAIEQEFEATRRILGSPPYMSPEMKRGTVSKQGDIYGLGACCLEMATGKIPTSPPILDDLINRTPAAFAAAIERSMHPEAIRRQSTVAEFAQDIGVVL